MDEIQCPSSSLTLECGECGETYECEILIWYREEEDDPSQTHLRFDIDYQPSWDHAFFNHTPSLTE